MVQLKELPRHSRSAVTKKGGDKEIYLPCRGFNNHSSNLFNLSPEVKDLAEYYYGSR